MTKELKDFNYDANAYLNSLSSDMSSTLDELHKDMVDLQKTAEQLIIDIYA